MAHEAPIVSPRIEVLRQELVAGNAVALERFWQEVSQNHAPLIEAIPGDDRYLLATFVWRAPKKSEAAAVVSNLNGQQGASEAMALLPGRTSGIGPTGCQATRGSPTNSPSPVQNVIRSVQSTPAPVSGRPGNRLDGLGVLRCSSCRMHRRSRGLRLRAGVSQGQVTLHRIGNEALDHEYRVWAYTPPNYAADGAPYGWLLMFDGSVLP